MIQHPLILRELLVAARRRSGFWTRIVVSAGAVLFGLVWLLQFQWIGRSAANGAPLLLGLSAVSWGFALASGPLMTADAISSERREGTLGLLHLSRLSPLEIVLSKFVSAATRLAPVLLGMVPVMTLCLLMGGLTLGEIARAALAIALTAAVSLAAGLLGSSGAWHGGFTTIAVFAFLVLWNLVPASVGAAFAAFAGPPATEPPVWASVSPWECLASARGAPYAADPARFWILCGSLAGAAVLLLATAALRMVRTGFLPLAATRPAAAALPHRRLRFPDDADPLAVLCSLSVGQRLTIWLPAVVAAGIDFAAVASRIPVEIFSGVTVVFCCVILAVMA